MLPKAVMTPIWEPSANMISGGKTRKTAYMFDSASSHVGPPAVQIPYADRARTVSQLHRVVMKLQLLVCIFTKCSPWISLCLPTKLQEHGIPSLYEHPWDSLPPSDGAARLGAPLPYGSSAQKWAVWGHVVQAATNSFPQATESIWVLLKPTQEAGIFHLWFPNCPDSGKIWIFCSGFIWLLEIIYPFSSVCSDVFHITSDIFSFHISCNIFIIFSWAIPFWKQITFS